VVVLNSDPKVVANGLMEGVKVHPGQHRLAALQQTNRDVSGNKVRPRSMINLRNTLESNAVDALSPAATIVFDNASILLSTRAVSHP
jgi:hypothetical protein